MKPGTVCRPVSDNRVVLDNPPAQHQSPTIRLSRVANDDVVSDRPVATVKPAAVAGRVYQDPVVLDKPVAEGYSASVAVWPVLNSSVFSDDVVADGGFRRIVGRPAANPPAIFSRAVANRETR